MQKGYGIWLVTQFYPVGKCIQGFPIAQVFFLTGIGINALTVRL